MMKYKRFWLAAFFVFCAVFNVAQAQHDPPVVVNDTVFMQFGEKQWVNLLANDYDPDGLPLRLFNCPFPNKTDSSVLVDMSAYRYMSLAGEVRFRYIVRQYPANGSPGRIGTGLLVVHLTNRGVDSLQGGQIKALVTVTDGQFSMYNDQPLLPGEVIDPGSNCTYNYPDNSSLATLFTQSLWIGGFDESNRLHFSGERYRRKGSDFWAGPLSLRADTVTIDSSDVFRYHRVWHLKAPVLSIHLAQYQWPGYQMPEEIATWPAHGDTLKGENRYLAPFVDVDGDGIYKPLQGDYPLMRGDEAIWFVLNDSRTLSRESANSLPLGVEVQCMVYLFHSDTDSALANSLFFRYTLFNRSLTNYHQVYLGLFADFDIGQSTDDFVKCDVTRGSMIGYNGDAVDGDELVAGYGDNPPAQSVTILGGPLLPPDGDDNEPGGCNNSLNGCGFGDGKPDNERIGMSRFIYFNNGSAGYMTDPDSASDYYNYMRGMWLDGSMVEYGGHGHYGTGAYGPSCRYMYPDESDPLWYGTACEPPFGPEKWTEEIAGNQPGDRRGLATMGPVELPAGGIQLLDLVLVTARGGEGMSSFGVLEQRIDTLRKRFLQNPDLFGVNLSLSVPTEGNKVSTAVYPNPATRSIRVELPHGFGKYQISNAQGQWVKQGEMTSEGVVDVEMLIPGLYTIVFTGKQGRITARFVKL